MHLPPKTYPRSQISGMTLVEVMVSMALGVTVIGAATWFLFEGTKASYSAMAATENSIQQWGLSAKLQIDGKVANNATILASIEAIPAVDFLREIPVDDGNPVPELERGNVLVFSKSALNEGEDSKVITDLIFYLYTPGTAPNLGTLKRTPAKDTFQAFTALDGDGKPKSVAQLVEENLSTLLSLSVLVQDHVVAVAPNGPFAHIGSIGNVSIALVREETALGKIKSSNLTEVSFNLR